MMADYKGLLHAVPDIDTVWTAELKKTHPYAVILQGHSIALSYFLYLSKTPFTAIDNSDSSPDVMLTSVEYLCYVCKFNPDNETLYGNSWELNSDLTSGSYAVWNDIWTSHNIYYEDGTLYLMASDSVGTPITDPVSFTMGYQIGCRLRAQRAVREPIGYSYNGTVLPELPGVEGYAVICGSNKYLWFSQSRVKVINTNGYAYIVASAGVHYKLSDDGLSWEMYEPTATTSRKINWANFDVYYIDSVEDVGGTIYLAASDPVPVYE